MRSKAPSTFRVFRRGVLFHIPQPRQYDVMPRYHDPDKERLEARYQKMRSEMGVEVPADEERIRRTISFSEKVDDKWARSSFSKQHLYSNLRLMLILVLLCVGFYIAYNYLGTF